jgi:hypothetical protein
MITLHKFVAIAAVPDHLRAGWMATQALRGTCHEQYSVHMVWLCACRPPDQASPRAAGTGIAP